MSAAYVLEYGVDKIEMHVDAVQPGQKVVLIDDLVATGGTAAAGAVCCAMPPDLRSCSCNARLRVQT